MQRRGFLYSSLALFSISLDTLGKAKGNSFSNLLIKFGGLFFNDSKHFLFSDNSLKENFENSLKTNWKGFVPLKSKFYIIGSKALCPIVRRDLNNEILDCAVLCFEKRSGNWINLKSLSCFHLQAIVEKSVEFPKEQLANTFLPKFTTEILPYSYKTENGEFYMKTSFMNGEFVSEIKVKSSDNEVFTNNMRSNLFC